MIVAIAGFAVIQFVRLVDREEQLGALIDFHVWTEETVAKRFHYRRPGLWILGVRIYRLPTAAHLAVTPEQLGCKTWVSLERPLPTAELVPALDDEENTRRMDRLRLALTTAR
jgi:hypothetical protein